MTLQVSFLLVDCNLYTDVMFRGLIDWTCEQLVGQSLSMIVFDFSAVTSTFERYIAG